MGKLLQVFKVTTYFRSEFHGRTPNTGHLFRISVVLMIIIAQSVLTQKLAVIEDHLHTCENPRERMKSFPNLGTLARNTLQNHSRNPTKLRRSPTRGNKKCLLQKGTGNILYILLPRRHCSDETSKYDTYHRTIKSQADDDYRVFCTHSSNKP